MEQIIRCVECLKPIKVYNFYCGDQSRCSDCQSNLDEFFRVKKDNEPWYKFINGEIILR